MDRTGSLNLSGGLPVERHHLHVKHNLDIVTHHGQSAIRLEIVRLISLSLPRDGSFGTRKSMRHLSIKFVD
jgi:hypothetical protein